jgi:hypothetical protein
MRQQPGGAAQTRADVEDPRPGTNVQRRQPLRIQPRDAARAAGHAAGAAFLHPLAQATQVRRILGSAAHAARSLELSTAGAARIAHNPGPAHPVSPRPHPRGRDPADHPTTSLRRRNPPRASTSAARSGSGQPATACG